VAAVLRLGRDWRTKALVQSALSVMPFGRSLNFRLQRLQGSYPVDDRRLRAAVSSAEKHIGAYEEFGSGPAGEPAARFFEFGAGWDLRIPLAHFALGVDSQVVYDITPHVRPWLVADIHRRLTVTVEASGRRRLEAVEIDPSSVAGVTQPFGIDYRAPGDARATGLDSRSVDCVTSTSTLEHIPRDDIEAILAECHRVLRPGGVCSFIVDYQDHYAYFDRSISVYNFLRYDARRWRWYNSALQFQNRLRHSDYLRLFERSGLQLVREDPQRPSAEQREQLRDIPLAEDFAGRPTADIEILGSHVVLQRP
jgi:hypothetical protein